MTTTRVKDAHKAAMATRGKFRGHLKGKCPPMGTDAAIFWQSAMMIVNPHKVSIGQHMFWDDDQRAFAAECERFVEDMHSVNLRTLDKDRMQLTNMGVW